jgi:hypothetical protein
LRQTCDERVELTAKADAEGRVQERRHEREARGDEAQKRDADGEPDDADEREHEADQLGELQRRYRLPFGDRSEARGDERREHQAVRVPTGSTCRANREDDGLCAQDHGRTDRTDAGHDDRQRQHAGGHPGREPRPADVHVGGSWIGIGRHAVTLLLCLKGWLGASRNGCSERAR